MTDDEKALEAAGFELVGRITDSQKVLDALTVPDGIRTDDLIVRRRPPAAVESEPLRLFRRALGGKCDGRIAGHQLEDDAIFQRALAREIEAAERRERAACADIIPTNWCDDMLSGPASKRLLGEQPWGCPEIERLLREIRYRINRRNTEAP